MAMIAITTSSSISVNPRRRVCLVMVVSSGLLEYEASIPEAHRLRVSLIVGA
jgi:hypothetical protein